MSEHNLNKENSNINDEIDLIELCSLIWQKKFTLLIFTFLVMGMTSLHQLFIAKEVYRSDAVIMPLNSSDTSSMLSQLGGLARLVGAEAPKSKNSTKLILNSRSFAQRLVEHLKLEERWKKTKQDSINSFQSSLKVEPSLKDPVIRISWDDTDPKYAKEVIEKVLEVAKNVMKEHAIRKSFTQVNFLKERLEDAKNELLKSEENLKAFQEKYQGVEIARQAEAIIEQMNILKSKQQNKEVELEVTKKILDSNSQEVRLIDLTINELDKKVKELVGDIKKHRRKGDVSSFEDRNLMEIPKIGLEYSRLYREVKINNKIYSMLLEQYELTKIESLKDVESFEVLDAPLVPENRIRPRRTMTVLVLGIVAMLCGVCFIVGRHYYHKRIKLG